MLSRKRNKSDHFNPDPAENGVKSRISKASDTMFYVNYQSNLNLNHMADRKAHFLIVLNVFLLSFFISKKHFGLFAKLHGYTIPNLFLLIGCITSIVLATLVLRPMLPAKKAPGQPMNWFFFGDFRHASLEEFHGAMEALWTDTDALYENMSRDLYWMGIALANKYRLLSRAYKVFFYCQLTTVSVYLLCFMWQKIHV